MHQRQQGILQEFTSPQSLRSFDDLDAVAAWVESTLECKDMPDVFVADNDAFTVAAMRTLQRHGVKVGQDIAVTGFNDFPLAGIVGTTAALLLARQLRCWDERCPKQPSFLG